MRLFWKVFSKIRYIFFGLVELFVRFVSVLLEEKKYWFFEEMEEGEKYFSNSWLNDEMRVVV